MTIKSINLKRNIENVFHPEGQWEVIFISNCNLIVQFFFVVKVLIQM